MAELVVGFTLIFVVLPMLLACTAWFGAGGICWLLDRLVDWWDAT
jgi:hypothetical protein